MRRLALASIALSIGLCTAAALLPAAEPGAVESEGLTKLTRALAATEAKEGATSPYLLPLIEEIAELRLRDGELAEAGALRRRALNIAIARFGSGSPSAAEAMVAVALVDIDRRHYLDAEPLLIAAACWINGKASAKRCARSSALASCARLRAVARPSGPWCSRSCASASRKT